MNCPHCGKQIDGHASLTTDQAPYDGAVAICAHCDQPTIFAFGASVLRKPTAQEWAELQADPMFQIIITQWVAFKHRNPMS